MLKLIIKVDHYINKKNIEYNSLNCIQKGKERNFSII